MKKFILLIMLGATLFAQANSKGTKATPDPSKPTAEEILSVSLHVRNFYRINSQVSALQAQTEQERGAAQAAAKLIETKYNCVYDLDTDVCTAKPAPTVEPKK